MCLCVIVVVVGADGLGDAVSIAVGVAVCWRSHCGAVLGDWLFAVRVVFGFAPYFIVYAFLLLFVCLFTL